MSPRPPPSLLAVHRPEYMFTEALSVALWENFGEQLEQMTARKLPIWTLGPEKVGFGCLVLLLCRDAPERPKPEEYGFLIKSCPFETKLKVPLFETFPGGGTIFERWLRLDHWVRVWQQFGLGFIFWAIDCMARETFSKMIELVETYPTGGSSISVRMYSYQRH